MLIFDAVHLLSYWYKIKNCKIVILQWNAWGILKKGTACIIWRYDKFTIGEIHSCCVVFLFLYNIKLLNGLKHLKKHFVTERFTLWLSWKLYNLPFIFDCYLWNNNLVLRQAVLILVWDVLLPRKKNVEHAQITWWIFSIFWAKGITTHLHHSITKTKAISLLYSKIGMCVWLH